MAQKKQETALTGLSNKEVLISREKYGNNLLTPPKRPSMWKLYLEKFRDPVIRILLVAAFFSLVIAIIENEYAETIGIFFAIFLATGIQNYDITYYNLLTGNFPYFPISDYCNWCFFAYSVQ